jgi:MSHA biogenesis protein MshO
MPLERVPLRQHGFTMIELVMVIVLLGILSVASTQFIKFGVGSYVDTARRDDLQQQARFVSERISRELRNALPGSVRAFNSGACLEFIPIDVAASYLDRVSDAAISSFQAVDFTVPSSLSQVAIYTLDDVDVYDSTRNAIADVASVSDPAVASQRTITLTSAHQFANESPTSRFYLTSTRVSFCAVEGALTRYSGYNTAGEANPQLPVIPNIAVHGGTQSLIAEHIRLVDNAINVSVFQFEVGTLHRSAVVHMDLRFSHDSASGEWLRFSQDVFLRNTP